MNKDKFQIGDLVTSKVYITDIGLVIGADDHRGLRRWEIYWFKGSNLVPNTWWYEHHLTKLSPTQEEQNE